MIKFSFERQFSLLDYRGSSVKTLLNLDTDIRKGLDNGTL